MLVACVAVFMSQSIALAEGNAPLSVIDWLGTHSETRIALPAPAEKSTEPPIADTATTPSVDVQPLGDRVAREIGLVPSSITGLPADLWRDSDPDALIPLIEQIPDLRLPAAQSLLYTVLLAEAQAPAGDAAAGDALVLGRVAKLQAQGALAPARALIEQAGVTTSPLHFARWMEISLLSGSEDRACDVLRAAPHLSEDYATNIFCATRAGAWENAALTFGSAQALSLMSPDHLALFDRFLHPEAFEEAPPLPSHRPLDPLSFRVFEAIGEPVSTVTLPRAYAVADLRALAGWKAQLEAAERLTRAGAIPDNQLLGLYSERKAAASGGVWDRVSAVQRLETALTTESIEAISKTLIPAWERMRAADLGVTFASIFAPRLQEFELTGRAATVADEVALLSPAYEIAAQQMRSSFVSQIALGEVPKARPTDIMQAAIFDAFDGAEARGDLTAMVGENRLGEAILHLLPLLHEGSNGKARALTDALATLRALGLEDTARRAALQTLLLRG